MTNLLFLYDNLLSPSFRSELRIPLHFISFAYIEGKMYSHLRNKGVFALQHNDRQWGNRLVYGAIFTLDDFEFHIRTLDGLYLNSMSTLRRNHKYDLHHRHQVKATPIGFQSLDDFSRLKYEERESVNVQCYFGNQLNPRIRRRLDKPVSYRIIDGIHVLPFRELYYKEE